MAGDPEAALALVGLGVRALSMAPASIPPVKRAIRGATQTDLERAAIASLGDASADEVRARLRALVGSG
jgi:phosphotransferase system enzyme I (PtsP)